jgi:hypothetical protein
MAIQLNSVRTVTAPVRAARPQQARAAPSSAKTSPTGSNSACAKAGAREAVSAFQSVLSGGLAAAGAASAAARSAATAAAVSAAATANSTAAAAATPAPAAATSDPNAVLTAEQVFGANPWVTDPTGSGPNGLTFGYNPLYFASASTAAEVAQRVGGKVVEDNEFAKDAPGDPFAQQQPNEMVELPNGALINPGLIASLYTHGYANWEVNQAISNEVASAEAPVTGT